VSRELLKSRSAAAVLLLLGVSGLAVLFLAAVPPERGEAGPTTEPAAPLDAPRQATSAMVALSVGSAEADSVLLIINRTSELSRRTGEYYAKVRSISRRNVCEIDASPAETISRFAYEREVLGPVTRCLTSRGLVEQILYLVTTYGVPMRIEGSHGPMGDCASVDSELAPLYRDLNSGERHPTPGWIPNPFFAQRETPFTHPSFPMYLVTRLTGYDWADIKGLIDRPRAAHNRGKVVLDAGDDSDGPGNDWLRTADARLPAGRVVFDESPRVLYDMRDVIGLASWGSNDRNRKRRMLGFEWLPGALATEYVSTDGRTFERPPANWNIATWNDRELFFAGSPQTLTADYIHEGATGASGHVWEPYLQTTPRPDHLFPAYITRGRNLAESYWASIPVLSWQTIVVGDPMCRLKP
jgi:uncharacterized protein (TIGR03790 family)